MSSKNNNHSWPAGVPQPREKLQDSGAQSLSDAELLALILRTGVAGKNVVVHAQELLDGQGGLYQLLNKIRVEQPGQIGIHGIGVATHCQLQAILELGERYLNAKLTERDLLTNSTDVKKFLRLKLAHNQRELFAVIFLNSANYMLRYEVFFHGTLNQAEVHPRDIARAALVYNSYGVILAHNHPSGTTQPSSADIVITQKLTQALDLFGIKVIDHIIVGNDSAYSFAENNLLPNC